MADSEDGDSVERTWEWTWDLQPRNIIDFTGPEMRALREHTIGRGERNAWRELWDDCLSRRLDGEYRFDMYVDAVAARVKLSEFEPGVWCYDQPRPDKRTWSLEAHLARYTIRMQIVSREHSRELGLNATGPYTDVRRHRHTRWALLLVSVMLPAQKTVLRMLMILGYTAQFQVRSRDDQAANLDEQIHLLPEWQRAASSLEAEEDLGLLT
ncbi:hypothetical protein G7046_g111 [Stylonectria norvegica]|nr:hypothetical protein G7046_g111 [Stylonectria norvegica]